MEDDVTDPLVAFVLARLDEDAAGIRALKVPHNWHTGPRDDPDWTDEELVCMWPPEFHTPYEQDKHWRGVTISGPELAAYVARHDPARVLREIDAKRQMVNEYAATVRLRDEASDRIKAAGNTPNAKDLDMWSRTNREASTLESWVGLLAAPYSDHPDYLAKCKPWLTPSTPALPPPS